MPVLPTPQPALWPQGSHPAIPWLGCVHQNLPSRQPPARGCGWAPTPCQAVGPEQAARSPRCDLGTLDLLPCGPCTPPPAPCSAPSPNTDPQPLLGGGIPRFLPCSKPSLRAGQAKIWSQEVLNHPGMGSWLCPAPDGSGEPPPEPLHPTRPAGALPLGAPRHPGRPGEHPTAPTVGAPPARSPPGGAGGGGAGVCTPPALRRAALPFVCSSPASL